MKKYLFTAAALLLVLTCVKAQQRKPVLSQSDLEFIEQAKTSGNAEVRLGELGQSQGTHTMVKEFGMMMVTDHQTANRELEELAKQMGHGDMPEVADAADDEAYHQLMKKKGTEFDKAFARQMIKDHEKAVRLFTTQAENGQNEQLKRWAAQKLSILKEHLEHARKLQETIKQQK